MSLSQAELEELKQRVLLLEGGNTPYQVQLASQIAGIDKSVQNLSKSTTSAIVSTRQELGLSIDGVEEVLSGDIKIVQTTIDSRFDKLLDYLENWIGCGSLRMDDIKTVVSAESSTGNGSTITPGSAVVSSATIKQDILTLKDDVQRLTTRFDKLLSYLETWISAGNISMKGIKDSIESE